MNDYNPLVSIIFPVFNVEKYLDDSLFSIFMQTMDNYEIIAVNDGSTDSSLSILKKWEKKFNGKLSIINQKNQGIAVARNIGLQYAKGQYIYFFDSDDYIHPNLLKHGVAGFRNDSIDIVRFNFTTKMNQLNDNGLCHCYKDSDDFFKNNVDMSCHVWRNIFKSDFLYKNNLYFTKNLLYEDIEFMPLAIWKADKIVHLDQKLYFYRQHGSSITNKNDKTNVQYSWSGKYLLEKLTEYQSMTTSLYFKRVLSNLKVAAIDLISPDNIEWILKMYRKDGCWTKSELVKKNIYYRLRRKYHYFKKIKYLGGKRTNEN